MPVFPSRLYAPPQGLMPIYMPQSGMPLSQGVNLPPGLTFSQGLLLGFVPNTNSNIAVNDVQTITIGGGAGTFTIVYQGAATVALANNASLATVQAALAALSTVGPPALQYGTAAPNIVVTGTPGSSYVLTFSNGAAGLLQPPVTVSVTGATTASVAHTTLGQPPYGYYNTYASGNSDGSQTPKCLLQFQCVTTIWGGIILGNGGVGIGNDGTGGYLAQVPAFFSGYYQASQLVGLDSNAVTGGFGFRVTQGDPSQLTAATTIVQLNAG